MLTINPFFYYFRIFSVVRMTAKEGNSVVKNDYIKITIKEVHIVQLDRLKHKCQSKEGE